MESIFLMIDFHVVLLSILLQIYNLIILKLDNNFFSYLLLLVFDFYKIHLLVFLSLMWLDMHLLLIPNLHIQHNILYELNIFLYPYDLLLLHILK